MRKLLVGHEIGPLAGAKTNDGFIAKHVHTRRLFSFIQVLRINISYDSGPNVACSVGMRDEVRSLPKLRQLFCLRTRL